MPSAVLPCDQVSGNRYCVHCSEYGDRQTCIASGVRCSVGVDTLAMCNTLNQQGGTSPDGVCSTYIGPSSARLLYHSTLTTAPKPLDFETNAAAKCPAACTHSSMVANKYCVHCSPSRRLTCVAAGGQPCMTSYQDAGSTYPAELRLCTATGTASSPDGVCYATLTAGSPPEVYSLRPDGKGVSLSRALTYICPGRLSMRNGMFLPAWWHYVYVPASPYAFRITPLRACVPCFPPHV